MSARQKTIALLLGLLLLLAVSYPLAISRTVALKKEHDILNKELSSFGNFDNEFNRLFQKEIHLDSVLTKLSLNDLSAENSLIRFLDIQSKQFNTILVDFNPTHSVASDNGVLSTYNFKIQGDFSNLLQVLHKIETESSFGEVSHVAFVKSKNRRTRKTFLQAEVLLQSFK